MTSACHAGSSLGDTAGPHAVANAAGLVQVVIAEQLHSQLSQSQVRLLYQPKLSPGEHHIVTENE